MMKTNGAKRENGQNAEQEDEHGEKKNSKSSPAQTKAVKSKSSAGCTKVTEKQLSIDQLFEKQEIRGD